MAYPAEVSNKTNIFNIITKYQLIKKNIQNENLIKTQNNSIASVRTWTKHIC